MKNHWIYKTPIAHRGLHGGETAENSLTAFRRAMDGQYGIELDVQLSRDGEIMVFHDKRLDRMTGVDAPVSDLSADELDGLTLGETGDKIPRLREVLETVGGRVPLLIEIKNEGLSGRLERGLCDLLDRYRGPYAIESFNPLSLYKVKKRSPDTMRGQLISGFEEWGKLAPAGRLVLSNMLLNPWTQPHFIACNLPMLSRSRTKKCRSRGLPVLEWTVHRRQDELWARAGCDNVIFEEIG